MRLRLIALASLLISTSGFAECFKTRGVIELGSGKTKAIIARVNTCVKPWVFQPLEILEAAVQYRNETIIKDGLRYLNPSVMAYGTHSIKKILSEMAKYNVSDVQAIATSVFRDPTIDSNGTVNGKIYLNELSQQFKLHITVLSQSQEATLAAEAALNEVSRNVIDFDRAEAVVWDIGGGSSQIVLPAGRPHSYDQIYLGQFGTVIMQEYVNRVLRKLPANFNLSANPVLPEEVSQLRTFVSSLLFPMDNLIREKIKKRKFFIGIGGVHKYSACELIYGIAHCKYTKEMIDKALQEFAGLTDLELYKRGRCPEYSYCRDKITNAALLQEIMSILEISEVITARTSAKEGVLVSPMFWSLDKR